MGHNTNVICKKRMVEGASCLCVGRDKRSQASQNDRESIVLLKLLNTISVALSNIQLDIPSDNVRPIKFDVHYFDRGGLSTVVTVGALCTKCMCTYCECLTLYQHQ